MTYYFIGPNTQDGDLDGFLDEANAILALDKLPQVLTTSYALEESSLSFALAEYALVSYLIHREANSRHSKLCQAYAQISARGTTLLFASGDGGPGCGNDDGSLFQPMFPSTCPL